MTSFWPEPVRVSAIARRWSIPSDLCIKHRRRCEGVSIAFGLSRLTPVEDSEHVILLSGIALSPTESEESHVDGELSLLLSWCLVSSIHDSNYLPTSEQASYGPRVGSASSPVPSRNFRKVGWGRSSLIGSTLPIMPIIPDLL